MMTAQLADCACGAPITPAQRDRHWTECMACWRQAPRPPLPPKCASPRCNNLLWRQDKHPEWKLCASCIWMRYNL